MTLGINDTQHNDALRYVVCHYAKWCVLIIVMLSVIAEYRILFIVMLSSITLSDIMLSGIMLSDMLSGIMLSGIMLSGITLSVVRA